MGYVKVRSTDHVVDIGKDKEQRGSKIHKKSPTSFMNSTPIRTICFLGMFGQGKKADGGTIINVHKKRAVQSVTDGVIESCMNELDVSELDVSEQSDVSESGERETEVSECNVSESGVIEPDVNELASDFILTDTCVDEAIAKLSVAAQINTPIRSDQEDQMLVMFNAELENNYEHFVSTIRHVSPIL